MFTQMLGQTKLSHSDCINGLFLSESMVFCETIFLDVQFSIYLKPIAHVNLTSSLLVFKSLSPKTSKNKRECCATFVFSNSPSISRCRLLAASPHYRDVNCHQSAFMINLLSVTGV